MATATRSRTMRLTETPGGPALVVTERQGDSLKRETYYLARADGAVRFTKTDGKVYTVRGAGASCDCPARFHGPKVVCRHRAAVKVLAARGRMPA